MTTPARREPAAPEQVPLIIVEQAVRAPALLPRAGSPSKVFRPWSPEQAALLPATKRDYLGDDHLAVFLLDLLSTVDVRPILDAYAEDRGQPPYDPTRRRTRWWSWSYWVGQASSLGIWIASSIRGTQSAWAASTIAGPGFIPSTSPSRRP